MLLNHARLRRDSTQRVASSRSTDRTAACGTPARSPGVRVLQSALAVQRPGRYQVEAAIAALHDDGKRRGDRLAADPRLVRRPRRPHRRPGAPGPRRGAQARGRGRPRPRRRRRAARDRPAARRDRRAAPVARCPRSPARASAATSLPPPRHTRMPPAGPRTSPSATTGPAGRRARAAKLMSEQPSH